MATRRECPGAGRGGHHDTGVEQTPEVACRGQDKEHHRQDQGQFDDGLATPMMTGSSAIPTQALEQGHVAGHPIQSRVIRTDADVIGGLTAGLAAGSPLAAGVADGLGLGGVDGGAVGTGVRSGPLPPG